MKTIKRVHSSFWLLLAGFVAAWSIAYAFFLGYGKGWSYQPGWFLLGLGFAITLATCTYLEKRDQRVAQSIQEAIR